MMSSELEMLDTNVLVYAYYEDSPHYPVAAPLLDRAQNAGAGLCISPQVLTEFFSTITNPRRVSNPFSPEDALNEMENIRSLPGLTVLPVPLDVLDRLIALSRAHPTRGSHIFDVHLVATMLGNGVRKLHTFNTGDFDHFDEIEVLLPTVPQPSADPEES
jgi:predicted nucleic acid-binding protein